MSIEFRSDAEVVRWWEMMTTGGGRARSPSECVDWADAAVEAFRARFSPDKALSPAESNAMYDFGYRFVPEQGLWLRSRLEPDGWIAEMFHAPTSEWARGRSLEHPGSSRPFMKKEKWDRKESLRTFLARVSEP
jgi:hypothetical protein